MVFQKKQPLYKVDNRVSIAMDALDDVQKQAVAEIIMDRRKFLENTSGPSKVRKISRTLPLYSLKGPSGLRIIYSQNGNDIEVMDLIRRVTLERYGRKPPRGRNPAVKRGRLVPPVKSVK